MTQDTKIKAVGHTAGPWVVEDYTQDPSNPEFFVIPATYFGTVAKTSNEADARLIAAVPEMLAALKSLQPIIEEIHAKWDEGMRSGKLLIALMDPSLNYRADITAIHQAIAKAEGRAS